MSTFHWADYVMCSASLLLSVGIGVFYGFRARHQKQNTAEDFMVGSRSLKIVPVALSLFVSWLSAISFMGDPVEVYYQGAVYLYLGIGYCLPLPIIAHVFAPVLNGEKVISIYEFLDKKYNMATRLMASGIAILSSCLYLGIVTYGPAVALSHVSGLPDWFSILLIGSIGTFYATLGGIKAVVWADAFQSAIMFLGVVLVITQGLITVGGFHVVWQTAERGNRLNFYQNSWLPVGRSIWIYIVGGFFRVLVPYISHQGIAQRYLSLPSRRAATIAVYLNIPMYIIVVTAFTLMGLIMYTHYEGCDPLESGRIQHADQLIPLFMLDMLGFLPGLPGLFLASVFAASLSSISSFVNSSATNTAKDFIEPLYMHYKGTRLRDRTTTTLAKLATFMYGAIVIGLAFGALNMKSNIFPLTFKITGLVYGPIGALFICAICFTFVKTWCALVATVLSSIVVFWIGINSFFYSAPSHALSTSVSLCALYNNTVNTTGTFADVNNSVSLLNNFTQNCYDCDQTAQFPDDYTFNLYHLSPMLYNPLGCTLSVLLAIVLTAFGYGISFFRSKNNRKNTFDLLPQKDDDKPQIHSYD